MDVTLSVGCFLFGLAFVAAGVVLRSSANVQNDESKLNDLIWTYVRAWQWRWQSHVHGQALLKKTGSYLAQM